MTCTLGWSVRASTAAQNEIEHGHVEPPGKAFDASEREVVLAVLEPTYVRQMNAEHVGEVPPTELPLLAIGHEVVGDHQLEIAVVAHSVAVVDSK